LFPTFYSGEDAAWIGGPEGFWSGVGFGDETVDGSLQVLEEDAALEAAPCELGEEASMAVIGALGEFGGRKI
jgi:hypothetical protein